MKRHGLFQTKSDEEFFMFPEEDIVSELYWLSAASGSNSNTLMESLNRFKAKFRKRISRRTCPPPPSL